MARIRQIRQKKRFLQFITTVFAVTKELILKNGLKIVLRGGADKFLARPTSPCRRTESIASLERGDCPCAELQVFSCYRGWKEACQATRAISTTSRCELSTSFYLQGKAPKEIHAILTETLGEHAPSHATVRNWVAQFKRGDFSTCDAPRLGRHKTVTTLEIIDQNHEIILEDRRISAKSIAEQLGISCIGFGPSLKKIWTYGSSPRSVSRNAWTRMKNVNGASRLSNVWNFFGYARSKSFPVANGNDGRNLVISLWPGDKTKQHSMEWRQSGSPRPKN